LPGSNKQNIQSIQGRLTTEQFKDLLTPGTQMYKNWCREVDTIAYYLKELQDAHVPILWRTHHEMNYGWFWWGGRSKEYTSVQLYRQMFDRFVNYHNLKNLIWEWCVDKPTNNDSKLSKYFVGDKYFDVASMDIYGGTFLQKYYDSLLYYAHGKPIALGEVGTPPPPETLKKQPKWCYYLVWSTYEKRTAKSACDSLVNDPNVVYMEKPTYDSVTSSFKKAIDLK